MSELPDTRTFAAATRAVPPEALAAQISCGPSPDRHLEAIGRYIKAGYDHLILVQIGPEQAPPDRGVETISVIVIKL
jgi:hypothetical protein